MQNAPSTTALILVDIQNDFLPSGALPVPQGDEVIAVANRAQHRVPLVVATQDWHPANHGSFAVNHPGRKPGDVIELDGLRQMLWPVHCVQHTRGAALAEDLDTSRIERIFYKGTDPAVDSYSGFFDNAHRRSTGLTEFLKDRKVDEVYVLGLATDYCVKATALDAVQLGFETVVIEDGCRGVEQHPGDAVAALEELRGSGIRVSHSRKLVRPAG